MNQLKKIVCGVFIFTAMVLLSLNIFLISLCNHYSSAENDDEGAKKVVKLLKHTQKKKQCGSVRLLLDIHSEPSHCIKEAQEFILNKEVRDKYSFTPLFADLSIKNRCLLI